MIEAIGVCRPYECFDAANIRQFIEKKNHKRMFFSINHFTSFPKVLHIMLTAIL